MKRIILQHVLSEIISIEGYTGENCKKCGRCRVELITLSSGNKYHICEKCRYIKEQDRYCDNDDFSYDIYSNNKTYLNEVIQRNYSERDCSNCKKQHTMACPNSSECYSTVNKPYYEDKDQRNRGRKR